MEIDPQETFERRFDPKKDRDLTARILGALGLYDASQDEYVNPPNAVSEWKVE